MLDSVDVVLSLENPMCIICILRTLRHQEELLNGVVQVTHFFKALVTATKVHLVTNFPGCHIINCGCHKEVKILMIMVQQFLLLVFIRIELSRYLRAVMHNSILGEISW